MANKGVVLISGVNGFIASRTAESFLKAGYAVRGTVRSLKNGKALQDALSEYGGDFELAEVPDITVEGAFDKAVKGVVAIAHMASPVSFFFTDPDPVIGTALAGTNSILNSALKAGPQLMSVVIISSIAAVLSPKEPPYTFTEKDWNAFSESEVKRLGKDSPGGQIYRASKVAAERAFWKFREEKRPSFTMTAVNPAFVTGPPLVPPEDSKNINETVRAVWTILSGGPIPPSMGSQSYVDNRDVARIMVFAVSHAEKCDGERFIAFAGAPNEQAIADILNKRYPERKLDVGTPGQGYAADYGFPDDAGIKIDGSKFGKVSGESYIAFEKSVLDAAKVFERYL